MTDFDKVFNFEPPFEVGEYKDIKIRAYLPKKTKKENECLGKEHKLSIATALILNSNYEHRKENYGVSALWYAPIIELDLSELEEWEKKQLKENIEKYAKYGKVKVKEND